MSQFMRLYVVYYPVMIVALVYCLVNLRMQWFSSKASLAFSLAFVGYFLATSFLFNYHPPGFDFTIFHNAGMNLIEGRNPYEFDGRMVSPLTSLLLFAGFALTDVNTSFAIWTGVNVIMALLLIPMAWWCLFGRIDTKSLIKEIAPLTAFFVLSFPILWTIGGGQLAIYVAFLLIMAFVLRDHGAQLGAGISLALATVKPQTVIPCLLDFLRRNNLTTWVGFCLSLVVLLITVRLLPHFFEAMGNEFEAMRDEMRNIATMGAPGNTNDYSFEAPFYHTIIGLNYLFYCLGFRDRTLILILSIGSTFAIGAYLLISGRQKRWPFEAHLSMICIYALLFFYHRFYDATILAIPLTYSYVMALRSTGSQRTMHFFTFIALLPVFVIHPKAIALFVSGIPDSMPLVKRLGEAFLLPYATWSALFAMVFIWLGCRQPSRIHTEIALRKREPFRTAKTTEIAANPGKKIYSPGGMP